MKIDWPTIRKPTIVFVSTLVVGIFVFVIVLKYNRHEHELFLSAEKEFTQTQQRYITAKRDKELYRQYLDSYVKLSAKGIVGKEQRLSWIEVLQDVNKRLQLSALRYEISPQQEANLPALKLPRNIAIKASKMHLNAGLLHEGDLVDLLETLKLRANGFYALDYCNISTRLGSRRTVRYQTGASYVNMDCALNWYTVEIKT
ncbi:MAG TPA: hypothetical protein VGL10_07745 [Gammaproteobacteria bacterium]